MLIHVSTPNHTLTVALRMTGVAAAAIAATDSTTPPPAAEAAEASAAGVDATVRSEVDASVNGCGLPEEEGDGAESL